MKLKTAFLVILGLLSIQWRFASAESTLPLQFIHLSPYIGKKLTLLFVQGQRPIVGTEDSQLTVFEIKAVVPSIEITHDSLGIQPVNIPRNGIGRANFLIAVIHSQPNYFWVNADESQTPPRDPRLKMGQSPLQDEIRSLKIQIYSRRQFDTGARSALDLAVSKISADQREAASNGPVVLEIQSPN